MTNQRIHSVVGIGSLIALFLLLAAQVTAQERAGWSEVGILGGFNAAERYDHYHQLTLYGNYRLSLRKDWPSGWALQGEMGVLASILRNHNDTVFLVSAGPGFTLRRAGFPLCLSVGTGAGLISEQVLERRNFGGHIHTHFSGSLIWLAGSHFTVGYRYHHMSNGYIYRTNPGINLHMISLGYRF